jgi:RNA polymerase sigma factor (TIGR02999 family)
VTFSQNEVTQLLLDWGNGDKAALDKLVPVVYQELRRLAAYYMRRERPGHTLQTSALVNEAYMRLVDYRQMRWQSRAHFFAVAAQAMRRILVEHARKRHFAKRGGGAVKVSFDEAAIVSQEQAADLVALDDALTSLEAMDQRKARIVELRYIGGLNIEETAEVLAISPATVQREWRAAKAWLYRAIKEGARDEA